jgi:hypothetical protein
MEGAVDITIFMKHLESNGLMIAPRVLVEERLEDLKLQQAQKNALNKKALTWKEIADAKLWGNISAKAVKMYAFKYAKPQEIFETKKGQITVKKLIISAVKRISKAKGTAWD